jgi:hypothetical protein
MAKDFKKFSKFMTRIKQTLVTYKDFKEDSYICRPQYEGLEQEIIIWRLVFG